DVRRPFLGRPLLRPASLTTPQFPTRRSRRRRNRVALEEDRLFRRLIPTDPEKNPKAHSTACRRRSDLWSPAAPSCRCRPSGEAGTAVPITHRQCTARPSRESQKWGEKPVDNGDIGNNLWNHFRARRIAWPRLPFRSPPPTSAKCLNRQQSLPMRPISLGSIRPSAKRY